LRAAERVRAALARAQVTIPDGGSARFTVSIGGAQAAGGDVGDLIRRADQALYAAKAAGRDQARMAS
jgi:diguanylate cyclase (GGDEF)-like protein